MTKLKAGPSFVEFIILVSMMLSLTALSIDAMLPALSVIGNDLNVQNPNDRQLIISIIFLGLAVGQLFFGPLSDKTGRKPAIYAGLACFMAGSLLSAFALNFPIMLFGRFLQGTGVSAPRAVLLALVRDQYEGRAMARVMSLVMTVFILVPMIAPLLGQAILQFTGWRSIFVCFVLLATILMAWFALRQPETLALEKRAPFSIQRIITTTVKIIKIRPALGFTMTAGLISGAHLGYLNSSQQIFQEQYALGALFPFYFATIAFSIGLASFLNARMVIHFGMRSLVNRALFAIFGLSVVTFGIALYYSSQLPLWLLMPYLMIVFFCIGILFGNLNSLAMEPLGSIAGIGAAIVGSLSTLISVLLGTMIGQSYNGTIIPLVVGMGALAGLSIFVVRWSDSG